MKVSKFLFTGPECSGKTTLTEWAARHWKGICVPEYARLHLHAINRPYELEDLLEIANQQLKLESLASRKTSYIFCDTSLLVIHIWMSEKFGTSLWDHGFDVNHLHLYDHVYLCSPDMDWQEDELREHEKDRQRLFDIYRNLLTDYKINFTIMDGLHESRKEKLKLSLSSYL